MRADIHVRGTYQPRLMRIRPWGDPVMVKYGFDIANIGTTNFQAVKCWNDGNREFGAVTNFLRIPHDQILKLRDLQFAQWWEGVYYTPDQKMNWLYDQGGGTLYFPDGTPQDWEIAPTLRWGTVSLGGNLVQVERIETQKVGWEDQAPRDWQMARLIGFQPSDWSRPLQDLLDLGLVHRCTCVYRDNRMGDTPKGIIYSPFYDPKGGYDFAGTARPTALYLPLEWLLPL